MDASNICDCEPSTLSVPHNVYHLHLPLYILDVVRCFQDHPKYVCGLSEVDIIEFLSKESFACGDLASQVKTALNELCSKGLLRFINNGYRTLGPIARLANARSTHQFAKAWNSLIELQKINCTSTDSS